MGVRDRDQAGNRKGKAASAASASAGEALSRGVLASTPDCVKVLDRDGRLLEMNAHGLALMQVDDFAPLRGRPWVELWPEEHRDDVRAAIAAARDGHSGRFQGACPTLKGAVRWWDVVVAPVDVASGRSERLVAVSRDVTEQKLAEQRELRLLADAAAANAKFRAFFEQGALFAGIMDLDGTILEPNRLSLEACGYTREQVVGKPFWECPWWTPARELVDQIKVAFAQASRGEIYRSELPYYVADGSERMVDFILLPIKDDDGRVVFLAPTGTDITDRRRLENELRRLAADLSEADRRKNEFLAMLAHELRNPLNPIGNAVRIIGLRVGDPSLRGIAEMMERQLGHLVRLVDDLLDVSRVSRGKIELRRETVDLAAVAAYAIEAASPLFEGKRQQLNVSVPEGPITMIGDQVRLTQVVGNLLTNAAKFTPDGQQIALLVERDDGQATIRVRDGGIGIAPRELPHVFEMFMQVDTALERSQAGLGIGLTLVRELVERHGGTVAVHSAGLGQGAEFVVRLPLVDAAHAVAGAVREPAPPPADAVTARRILVVDDNRDAVESLGMLLETEGHLIHAAYDGLEAVAKAAEVRPDVVLLDIGLPKLNGYEAARRIREQPWGKQVVLIALTGWGQDEDRRQSQEAGFDAHLVKPVEYRALADMLATLPALERPG